MRRGRVLVIVISGVILSLVAAGGVLFFVSQQASRSPSAVPQEVAVPMTQVVVAMQNIPRGTGIVPDLVARRDWPRDNVPPDVIADESELIGKVASTDIFQGQPIVRPMLVRGPSALGISPMTQVIVAVQNIPRGAEITPDLIAWRDWPRDNVPPDVIADEAELIGKVARINILQASPIVSSMLVGEPLALEIIPMTQVIVALEDIPRGTEITPDLVGWSDWPRDNVPPDVIADESELIGTVANIDIFQGQPIMRALLAEEASASEIIPTTQVMVALQDIPRGAEITPDFVGWSDWPRDNVPPDVIADEAELIGKVARVDISQGSPIMDSMLSEEPSALEIIPMTQVIVALQNIPEGTGITSALVARRDWPRGNVPPDVIANESELIGKLASIDIFQGQPIVRALLAEEPSARKIVPMTQVIVALQDIPSGAEITPELIGWRDWPRDSVPPDVIADETELRGRVASTDIFQGQPIMRSVLAYGTWWETFTPNNSDLAGPSILTLAEDTQGRIWAGTESGGISRFQEGMWEAVLPEGSSGDQEIRITDMLLDRQGILWVATFGNGVLRFEDDNFQRFTSDSSLGSDVVLEIYEDSLGKLWFGTENGATRFDGENWESFTPKDGLAGQVTVITEGPNGVLWLGGPDGLTRYDGESWVPFTAENSGLVTDEVQDLLVDGEGNLWVSTFRETQTERSQWPALSLTVLAFGGMLVFTYYRYDKMPETRAQRIHRTLRQQSDTLYLTIYRLFDETPDAPEVLKDLAEEMGYVGDHTGGRVVTGLAALPSAESLDETLPNSVAALADGRSYEGGAALYELYRLFAAAYKADTVPNITALEITIIPNLPDDAYTVSTSLGDIKVLPSFLSPNLPTTLTALEGTADALMKHEQVDTLGDKLAYLADALHEIEKATQSTRTLTEPEKTVLAEIAVKWREVIAREIAKVSGQAELKAELRTKQALFSERLGAVLRLENTGQAVAENVTVSLEPSEEYKVIGEATMELARVSTKRPGDARFTIHPKREDRVRLDFVITWDDREGQGKTRRFADTVSLAEVEREFTRIPNPYVAGNPITSPKLFFGREDVFSFVLEGLVGAEQKNTLVLHGQRRTGKSSVLLQLRDRVLSQEFIPVYINMEALPDVKTMETFLARLAYEIGRAARKRGLELEVPTDFSQQPAMTFDRFMDAAEDALSRQRFVVMFDEFELIESKIAEGMDAGVLNYFRNLMQHRDSLVFVFTGTHRLQEMTHDYWSILFSIALNREISFLGEADTRQLITEPVQDHLEYDDLTIEKIIRVTHCQPYLVQLVCWQLVNYLNGQKRNYATINDVDEVLDQTLVAAEAHFNSIWIQSTPHQRLTLALLSTLLRPGKETAALSEIEKGLVDKGVAITGHELIAALSELCRRDVLEERTNGELRYRFQIDLVWMWIEKNKPLLRVLIEEGL